MKRTVGDAGNEKRTIKGDEREHAITEEKKLKTKSFIRGLAGHKKRKGSVE